MFCPTESDDFVLSIINRCGREITFEFVLVSSACNTTPKLGTSVPRNENICPNTPAKSPPDAAAAAMLVGLNVTAFVDSDATAAVVVAVPLEFVVCAP